MLKKLFLAGLVVAIAAVGFIWTRESMYSVRRSITVHAPAELVFGMVNDLSQWVEWSPWDSLDPNMQKTFDGPKDGVGARYAWKGNEQVGVGQLTIIESRPPSEVSYRLEFTEPWSSVSNLGFSIEPESDGVFVTWTMLGENSFVGKASSLFVNVDEMVGPDFERGLATLKAQAEARTQTATTSPAPAD